MIAEARAGLARLGNDKTGARQYLEEALSYAPDKSDTLSELSRVLVELGQYEAAQEVLRNAQERGIVSFTLSSDLGWALIKLNRKKEAATVIREAIDGPDVLAIKKSLQFNWAAHWLSRYYFRHGRFRDLWAISMRQVDLEEELTAQKKAFQQRI